MKTHHQLINQNSNNLRSIATNSVDLIVTSPPYPMIEMWDSIFINQNPTISNALALGQGVIVFEKMHRILDRVWSECDRVLSHNGFICINIGDATRTVNGVFHLFPNHARIISAFMNMGGYCLLPDIHWRKRCNTPTKFMGSGMYPAGAYVTYEHEYILIFILLISPKCFMRGERLFVTAIGYGSISDAHTGSMPQSTAASGKPPEPSNKLPSVIGIVLPPFTFLITRHLCSDIVLTFSFVQL